MDVVKIGGADGVAAEAVCADIAKLWKGGWRGVVVHGGSGETDRLAEALGHPSQTVTSPSGQTSRRTDRRTLEIFAMATGLVNRRLVEGLRGAGVNALGLSGLDGGAVRARRKAQIRAVAGGRTVVLRDEWTGTPVGADRRLLRSLLSGGHLPVVAPLASGEHGEMLNVDGDRAAAAIAAALGATSLVILTNVPGVLERFPDERTLIRRLAPASLERVMGAVEGRMRKKVLGAMEALRGGVPRVVIGDSRLPEPLAAALRGEGTVIEAEAAAVTEVGGA